MSAMNLNAPTYYLLSSTANAFIQLTPQDADASSLIITNLGSTAVALTSQRGSAPTTAFPASATIPVGCAVVGPFAIVTMSKNIGDDFISGITKTGGGDVFIQVGPGE